MRPAGEVVDTRILPLGVELKRVTTQTDDRGTLSEIFRADWGLAPGFVQWNVIHSNPGAMRGVHVHLRHTDYLVVVAGSVSIGVTDLRRGSATERTAAVIEMTGDVLTVMVIPPGVAHGILSRDTSIMFHGMSHHWDPDDDLVCHWADPLLAIPWPLIPVTVSPRDATASTVTQVISRIPPYPGG